jgi:hypothetical protein
MINPSLVFVILLLWLPKTAKSQYEGLDSTRKQAQIKIDEAPFADEIVSYRYKLIDITHPTYPYNILSFFYLCHFL